MEPWLGGERTWDMQQLSELSSQHQRGVGGGGGGGSWMAQRSEVLHELPRALLFMIDSDESFN